VSRQPVGHAGYTPTTATRLSASIGATLTQYPQDRDRAVRRATPSRNKEHHWAELGGMELELERDRGLKANWCGVRQRITAAGATVKAAVWLRGYAHFYCIPH